MRIGPWSSSHPDERALEEEGRPTGLPHLWVEASRLKLVFAVLSRRLERNCLRWCRKRSAPPCYLRVAPCIGTMVWDNGADIDRDVLDEGSRLPMEEA